MDWMIEELCSISVGGIAGHPATEDRMGTVLSFKVKRPEREANHSSPSPAEFRNT
jgi:hypothetical protein